MKYKTKGEIINEKTIIISNKFRTWIRINWMLKCIKNREKRY